ncbi:MAG TPA: gliding motility-associated protein GldE [Draconibacterium sp.]|nr:gliding motility-associated protein GldE [Draconibacterium sp.]
METDTLLASSQISEWSVQFQPFTVSVFISLVLVLLLLIFSALVSGSEAAYFSLSTSDNQKLKKTNKNNARVLNNLANPEKMLTTILVANIFINIGIIVLMVNILTQLISFQNLTIAEFVLQVILISFLLLVFSEILPKILASRYKLGVARIMAFPLHLMQKIFSPITGLFIYSNSLVERRLQKRRKNFSMDEISKALKLTSEQELSEEKEILEGIAKFGNKNVAEIMKPRVDVVSLDIKTSFSTVLDLIVDSGFSRIPVYVGSFDNIKGILYIKDILPHSHKGGSFNWQTLIRPPFYVPETKKINSLLKEFQKNKVHLAVVIDEYGGTSGIVTLEDVLEEIVGEIVDEFDEEEHFFSKISENIFLFDGKTLLGDFFKVTKCDDTVFNDIKGDAETLAGLILELKGEIPVLHEKIEYQPFVFTIEAVDDRRIIQIKVEINRNNHDEKQGRNHDKS